MSVNKTLVVQGDLTFVAAIACSDAVREITLALKRDTVGGNAMLKGMIALVIIIIIGLISNIRDGSAFESDTMLSADIGSSQPPQTSSMLTIT